jgi:hypothetical protein
MNRSGRFDDGAQAVAPLHIMTPLPGCNRAVALAARVRGIDLAFERVGPRGSGTCTPPHSRTASWFSTNVTVAQIAWAT